MTRSNSRSLGGGTGGSCVRAAGEDVVVVMAEPGE